VIGQAKRAMAESTAKVRDRGAPNEAGVVQGEMRFALRQEVGVKIGQRCWVRHYASPLGFSASNRFGNVVQETRERRTRRGADNRQRIGAGVRHLLG